MAPTFRMAVRLRIRSTALSAMAMAAVIVMVGALFPAVGTSIGKLELPEGVSELLGGADYGTLAGWMKSEIGAVYGPLVIAAVAIGGAGSIAGEEESGIFAVLLAHPVGRVQFLLARAAAVGVSVLLIALGTLVGLIAGVAVGGGGVGIGELVALAVHLAFFGAVIGAVALAIAGGTGSRALATGGAAAFALLGFLINGFAPLVGGLTWLKFFSPFYYYAGHDPLGDGIDLADLAVLGSVTVALTAVAAWGFIRRDLRA